MKKGDAVLAVKFKSSLDPEKLMQVCVEDKKVFQQVPGLTQKYYVAEQKTGAISGIYFFENASVREAFSESALAKTIGGRYGVIPETLRVEQYEMMIVLNETAELDC